jgi:uncharacterized protein (DUF362 family)
MVKLILVMGMAVSFSGVGAMAQTEAPRPPETSAEVFLQQTPMRGGEVSPARVRRMVDELVMAATGRSDIAAAWRSLVHPRERVGLKVSTSAAPVASTHPAIVEAVAEGLVAAGVPPDRIVIWDRKWDDIARAGYEKLGQRFVVTSTDRSGGYNRKEVATAAVMGRLIHGDRDFDPRHSQGDQMSGKSYLSNVLVTGVDKVVLLPALTDHLSSGMHGALSAMVLDNLDNWRRLARPPHYGDPFLAELYADPRIGGKVVLTILDALRPQYAGGPFPEPQYVVNHGAIYASRDPVAIDVLGVELLDGFRQQAGMLPLSKMTEWLASAEVLGLGLSSREKIRVFPVGAAPAEPRALQP